MKNKMILMAKGAKSSFSLLILMLWLCAAGAKGATLHTIVFAATDDAEIGEACAANRNHLFALSEAVSRRTGMDEKRYAFEGADFSVGKLRELLDGFAAGPDDMVFFYYSGHGFADKGSEFPRLVFKGGEQAYRHAMRLEVVRKRLAASGARMALAFADCCNHAADQSMRGLPFRFEGAPEAYRALFLQARGRITLVSSKSGQAAAMGGSVGGLCSWIFFQELNERLSDGEPTDWEALLSAVREKTRQWKLTVEGRPHRQEPYYRLELER